MGDKVKKVVISIMILSIFLIPMKVEAKTLNDLYDELEQLENEYNQANSDKKLTDEQIKALESEIATINSNITQAKEDITQAQKDIEDSNKQIEEKKNETNELMKFLQITSGGNVYLEYLFEAESYTDFIYRYSIVTQMSGYNNKLMDELETLITNLENKKVELANKQKELEQKREESIEKTNKLRANLAGFQELGASLEDDIADLKDQIDYYENTLNCSPNQDLTTCSGTPYAKGWKYPLAYGCVTSEYTGYEERPDWSGGGGHHAIDLSCVPEGTPVYAAAAGTVARVSLYNSCGGNIVWINHIVNGQAYTTVYMHLLTVYVSNKQEVTDQTVIGLMGGGSTASYDGCTGGAHLHFGLSYGHHSNSGSFNAYSFNPRDIFYFPPMYGGYFYR